MDSPQALQTLSTYADIAQIVVGVAASFIAVLALRASKRISNQQFRLTNDVHRAHVLPEHASVKSLEIGKPIEVVIAIKNRGQTPALQVRMQPRIYVSPREHDSMLGVPLKIDSEKAEIHLAPNDVAVVDRIGKDDPPLTERQFTELKSGNLILHCDYLVEYLDISGTPHRTYVKLFLKADHVAPKAQLPLSHGKGAISIA